MRPFVQHLGPWARRFAAAPAVRRFAAAMVLGALAFAVLGDTPASQRVPDPGRGGFTLPAAPAVPEAAIGVLAAAPVWASQPVVVAEIPEVAPPPRLLAIMGSRNRPAVALFEWPDGRRARVSPGEILDGEGRVEAISATSVGWVRADGTRLEGLLYQNPEPRVIPPDDPT